MAANLWQLMRNLPCTECGAKPGEPCLNRNGKATPALHPARFRAAKKALAG